MLNFQHRLQWRESCIFCLFRPKESIRNCTERNLPQTESSLITKVSSKGNIEMGVGNLSN